MSRSYSASNRSAIASAALISLTLLAGCQSSSEDGNNAGSAVASTGTATNGTGTMASDPLSALDAELARVGDRVRFGLDRYDLSPDAETTLQRQAALLQTFQPASITIEGHADERGTREYNLALGERRAE